MNLDSLGTAAAHAPADWIIIGAFAVLVAADSLRAGSNRACALALALPVAFVDSSLLGGAAFLGNAAAGFSSPVARGIVAAALLLVSFLFAYRIVGFYGGQSSGLLPALIAGCATAAVVVVFWIEIPGLEALWRFGPQVQSVFAEQYRFWWLAGGYLALAFARS